MRPNAMEGDGMDLRATAMDILTKELPDGVQYLSNAPGAPNRFEQLTGYSHATLAKNWAKGGKETACMGYVAHYCQQMRARTGFKEFAENLGRFDLEAYLPTIGKEY